jgi:DNA-binding MarR family transcriptional regulator
MTLAEQLLICVRSKHELTVRQLALLTACAEQSSAEQRQVRHLASFMGDDRPYVTRAADRLEELGWIERYVPEDNRRMCILGVTKPGYDFLGTIGWAPAATDKRKIRRKAA